MISRRPYLLALALLSPMVLAACSSSPETGTTATGAGGSTTTASSTAGSGGNGGSGGSSVTATTATAATSTATSSATTTTTTSTSTSTSTSTTSSSGSGGAASCAAEIDADLAMKTMGLLYLSESDYPFETINLKDPQGSGVITPAHLLALLGMDPLLATETRTIPVFFDNLLNNSPDSAQYQIVLDTLQSTLTDLTVIRITPAAPQSAQIQIYVVGRTTCGEIAGLKTVSVET